MSSGCLYRNPVAGVPDHWRLFNMHRWIKFSEMEITLTAQRSCWWTSMVISYEGFWISAHGTSECSQRILCKQDTRNHSRVRKVWWYRAHHLQFFKRWNTSCLLGGILGFTMEISIQEDAYGKPFKCYKINAFRHIQYLPKAIDIYSSRCRNGGIKTTKINKLLLINQYIINFS